MISVHWLFNRSPLLTLHFGSSSILWLYCSIGASTDCLYFCGIHNTVNLVVLGNNFVLESQIKPHAEGMAYHVQSCILNNSWSKCTWNFSFSYTLNVIYVHSW